MSFDYWLWLKSSGVIHCVVVMSLLVFLWVFFPQLEPVAIFFAFFSSTWCAIALVDLYWSS